MNFRARLSLFALESRENPSGPSAIDPTGGTAVVTTTTTDPTAVAVAAATAGATATTTTTTTTATTVTATNTVYNTPVVGP